MSKTRVRRRASVGARREREGCPDWADNSVIATADQQGRAIEICMLSQLLLPSIAIAATGAQILASAARRHYSVCDDADCEACSGMVNEDFRAHAHEMLDFYLTRTALACEKASGSA